jgi:ATP-binding cassette, subfamily B, multidrug efflux pump
MYKAVTFGQTLKRLLGYGSTHKKTLILGVLMLMLAAAAQVMGPLVISHFIDQYIAKRYWDWSSVLILAAGYISLQLLASLFNYRESILFNRAAIAVVNQLRDQVMQSALRQPLSTFDNHSVGQLISRVTSDTEAVRDLWVSVIAAILRSITLITAMLIAMYSLNWRMALVVSLMFPLVFFVMVLYQKYSTELARKVRSYLALITQGLNEVITGMTVIQQFRQQRYFAEKMQKNSINHYHARMRVLRLDARLLRPLLNLFSATVLTGLVWLFAMSSSGSGAIEVGVLYAFIAYLGRVEEPLIELTSQQSILQQSIVSAERIFELIDLPGQEYGGDERPISSGCISARNLSFSYQPGEIILDALSFEVASGGFLALVGHTGSGKTTLASLLMGYYPLTAGQLYIDNRPLASLSHAVLRNGIAMVQQDPMIFPVSLAENIRLGTDIAEEQIWQVLEKVQLANLVRSWPQGLATMMGEEGNTLSLGQKQLLALARVLVRKPAIVILDEATASIDSETEQAIGEALQALRTNTTLVVIAHRLSTIIEADTILVLRAGVVVESGNHQALLAQSGYYARMHQLQHLGEQLHR